MNWKTQKYLVEKFQEYNRKYFGNKLQGKIQVGWGKPTGVRHAAEFLVDDKDIEYIIINSKLRDNGLQNYALSRLLHEMCHMKMYQEGKRTHADHGTLFQKEMKRLAGLGAFRSLW